MDDKSKELTMFEKMQITDEYLDETDCVMMSKVVKHLLDDLAETMTDLHHMLNMVLLNSNSLHSHKDYIIYSQGD